MTSTAPDATGPATSAPTPPAQLLSFGVPLGEDPLASPDASFNAVIGSMANKGVITPEAAGEVASSAATLGSSAGASASDTAALQGGVLSYLKSVASHDANGGAVSRSAIEAKLRGMAGALTSLDPGRQVQLGNLLANRADQELDTIRPPVQQPAGAGQGSGPNGAALGGGPPGGTDPGDAAGTDPATGAAATPASAAQSAAITGRSQPFQEVDPSVGQAPAGNTVVDATVQNAVQSTFGTAVPPGSNLLTVDSTDSLPNPMAGTIGQTSRLTGQAGVSPTAVQGLANLLGVSTDTAFDETAANELGNRNLDFIARPSDGNSLAGYITNTQNELVSDASSEAATPATTPRVLLNNAAAVFTGLAKVGVAGTPNYGATDLAVAQGTGEALRAFGSPLAAQKHRDGETDERIGQDFLGSLTGGVAKQAEAWGATPDDASLYVPAILDAVGGEVAKDGRSLVQAAYQAPYQDINALQVTGGTAARPSPAAVPGDGSAPSSAPANTGAGQGAAGTDGGTAGAPGTRPVGISPSGGTLTSEALTGALAPDTSLDAGVVQGAPLTTDSQVPFTAGADLTALRYVASNPDASGDTSDHATPASAGTLAAAGRQFYNNVGAARGDKITFDPEQYLAANPDVAAGLQAQGLQGTALEAAATLDYIQSGRQQGRPAAPGPQP